MALIMAMVIRMDGMSAPAAKLAGIDISFWKRTLMSGNTVSQGPGEAVNHGNVYAAISDGARLMTDRRSGRASSTSLATFAKVTLVTFVRARHHSGRAHRGESLIRGE